MRRLTRNQNQSETQASSSRARSNATAPEPHPRTDLEPPSHDTIGNQALQRLRGPVQIAPEAEEKKADAVARGDMAAASSRAVPSTAAPEGLVPGAGEPLPDGLRRDLEAGAGRRLDEVRVHRDGPGAALAGALGARAYAAGNHLVFGRGEWAPHSREGRGLIAHEVAHVIAPPAQGQIALQKKDVEPPLKIDVPEAGPGDVYQPAAKYPWQNQTLRESIYPYRDEMLSFFLQTYRELELRDDPSQAPDVAADAIRTERASVQERQTAVNERLKGMLKRKVSKESMEWKQAQQEWSLLRANLNYLPDPDSKERKKKKTAPTFTQLERIHWAAYKYARLSDSGKALTHDERLGKVLDRFDADPSFSRYPEWLRYMVVHLSGMRYASAHRSWAPAVELVNTLKRDQVRSSVARMSRGELAQESEAADIEGQEELATLDKKKDAKRIATLKARHKAFAAVDPEIEKILGKPGTADRDRYTELVRLDGIRAETQEELKVETDPTERQMLLDIQDDALSAATEIEVKLGSKFKRVRAVEGKAREALVEHELEKALATLPKDEYGALWVLKKMHDDGSLPEFVWREIVRKTPLKHDQAGADWESVTASEKESKSRNDETTRRWIEIMKKWVQGTAWREKHRADLSLVTIQAVCDQVAEMSQHARGVTPKPGIGQKAAWYATPGASTSFGALDAVNQLKPGASLLFSEWSTEEPKLTDPVHVVRHDQGYLLRNEDNQTISDGFADSMGWKYSFLTDGRILRSKKEVIGTSVDPDIAPPTQTVTQWMRWKHEAVVVESDAAHGRVLTFETGPIGLRLRLIDELVGKGKVYIGFAPGGNAPVDVKTFLKDVLPGR